MTDKDRDSVKADFEKWADDKLDLDTTQNKEYATWSTRMAYEAWLTAAEKAAREERKRCEDIVCGLWPDIEAIRKRILTPESASEKAPSAWEQAASLFPELRNFTSEERASYNNGLSKLFQRTGRKLL